MADPSPAPMRRLMPWILWSMGGISILSAAFVVLWLWLPRWAPEWVMQHSPWVDPVLRAVASKRIIPEWIHAEEAFAERVKSWGDSAVPAYVTGMESVDASHRMVSVAALCGLDADRPISGSSPPEVIERLAELAVTDDDVGVRMWAFRALPRDPSASLSATRARGMRDRNWIVRCAVVRGLDSRVSEVDWSTLSGAMSDQDEKVLLAAILRVSVLREQRAIPRLVELLGAQQKGDLFRSMVEAVGVLKAKEALPVLHRIQQQATKSGRTFPLAIVTKGIAQIDEEEGLSALVELLRHQDPDFRAFAAMRLGELGNPRAIGPLVLALQETELLPLSYIISALARLQAASAMEAIVERLESGIAAMIERDRVEVRGQDSRLVGDEHLRLDVDDVLKQVGTLPLTPALRQRVERLRPE